MMVWQKQMPNLMGNYFPQNNYRKPLAKPIRRIRHAVVVGPRSMPFGLSLPQYLEWQCVKLTGSSQLFIRHVRDYQVQYLQSR
jgi:hypothetical protein